MITILRLGKPEEGKKRVLYKTQCPNCDCIFTYEENDINRYVDEEGLHTKTIICPHCDCPIEVNLSIKCGRTVEIKGE